MGAQPCLHGAVAERCGRTNGLDDVYPKSMSARPTTLRQLPGSVETCRPTDLQSIRCRESDISQLQGIHVRNLSFAALILLLAGCATTGVEEVRAPDGSIIKSVKCVSDSNKCMMAASASCSDGTYRVIDSSSNAGGALADLMPGPFTWYRMQYVCGKPDGKMPSFVFRGPTYTPPPVVVTNPTPTARPSSTTTNCQKIGNQVSCTTY